MIHLSCLETTGLELHYSEFSGLLSSEELRIHDRFVLAIHAHDYALARVLARLAKSLYEDGSVDERPPDFSLLDATRATDLRRPTYDVAQTHGLVVCAVSHSCRISVGVASLGESLLGESTREGAGAVDSVLSAVEVLALTRAFNEIRCNREPRVSPASFKMMTGDRLAFMPPPGFDILDSTVEFALFAPTLRHRVALAVTDLAPPVSVVARRADDGHHVPLVAATESVAGS
jgi:hypothetical protein